MIYIFSDILYIKQLSGLSSFKLQEGLVSLRGLILCRVWKHTKNNMTDNCSALYSISSHINHLSELTFLMVSIASFLINTKRDTTFGVDIIFTWYTDRMFLYVKMVVVFQICCLSYISFSYFVLFNKTFTVYLISFNYV